MSVPIELTKGKFTQINENIEFFIGSFDWYFEHGYAARTTKTKESSNAKRHNLFMHRVVYERFHGPIPEGLFIDHINGDKLDNMIENLRVCSNKQNCRNQYKKEITKSKYKGVSWHKRDKYWYAYGPGEDENQHYIGRFETEEDAARVYDNAVRRCFGAFARPNFENETF
jgi:hypothetical protein